MSKTSTLEVITAAPADLGALATAINATHASAKSHAQLAVVFAVRTGVLCERAKEALPHGQFTPWLEKNCPQITTRTVQKYMALVDAASKNDTVSLLGNGDKNESGSFLTAPDFLARIEEDASYREQVSAQVREAVGEGSLTDLYKDWGVVHGPKNVDAETGKRVHYPAKEKKLTQEQIAKANRAAAKGRIVAALAALKAAIDDKQVRRWLDPKDWIDLSKLAHDRVKALTTLAEKAQAAAAAKGKK